MNQPLLISSMTNQDYKEFFESNNTFSSQLTLEDFKHFFENCGISVSDIQMCEWFYQVPAIIFTFNSQKYMLLYSDVKIALQDVCEDSDTIDICYNKIDLELLAILLHDSWLLFMYEKFSYGYILTYPALGKKSLKERNYINAINDSELKKMIISLISQHSGKANCFYGVKEDEVSIKELKSFYNSERRFLITKISNGLLYYIKISDYEIIYPQIADKKFFRFMVKYFGDGYLHGLREYALIKLHEEEVPKFIEKHQKQIDKFISQLIKKS